jgi:hypothetical protein
LAALFLTAVAVQLLAALVLVIGREKGASD